VHRVITSHVWQRIKRNTQGLRNAGRTVETMDLVDALKGSLNLEHVHLMITVGTSTITLDELEEKVLTMGQHVDQVLMRESFRNLRHLYLVLQTQTLMFSLITSTSNYPNSQLHYCLLPLALQPKGKVEMVDVVVTVEVVAEVGEDVANARNTVGTVEEIIISYCVPELFLKKRRRKVIPIHMTMREHSSQKFISTDYTCPDLHRHQNTFTFLAVTLNLTITMLRSCIMLHFLIQCQTHVVNNQTCVTMTTHFSELGDVILLLVNRLIPCV
jgi:hypothetical protein